MRLLLGQLEPRPGDVAANARAVAEAIASAPTADLAVFPELFLGGYAPRDSHRHAVRADGPELAQVADAAREAGTAVVVGFAERLDDGGVANAAACFDSGGELRATYRKTHLFGGVEQEVFTAGEALCVVELAGAHVAPLICFDMEFPEPARAVSRAGAQLLVTIAANMEPYGPDHALAARGRALDNRRPHVYVNRTGEESGLRFCGGSVAVGADGAVTAEAGPLLQLVETDVPVGAPAAGDVDYLSQIRSGLDVERPRPFTPNEGVVR